MRPSGGAPLDGMGLQKPWQIQAYLGLSSIAGPLYRLLLRSRLKQGKEVAARIGERFGKTDKARPDGFLVWFHAASVGESQALLTPLHQILAQVPDLHVLVTTTTRTSAELLSQQLPERAMHQFSPVDTEKATRAFLRHWQPDLAIWTESEIWPRLMIETAAQRIPMHLINARVSPKTAERWRSYAKPLSYLLDRFATIATQDEATRNLITDLGIDDTRVTVTGSTKSQAAPLPHDPETLSKLRDVVGARNCWLAASTHPGEEEYALAAHQEMLQSNPDALLILVPRHPERAEEVRGMITGAGLSCAQRSQHEALTDATQVYLADTMGEMGLWYRLAPISFVGGSLVPIGGHNPYEPIALGSSVISGPKVYNFEDVYTILDKAGGVTMISDGETLGGAVQRLQDNVLRSTQNHAAVASVSSPGGALDHVTTLVLDACKAQKTRLPH